MSPTRAGRQGGERQTRREPLVSGREADLSLSLRSGLCQETDGAGTCISAPSVTRAVLEARRWEGGDGSRRGSPVGRVFQISQGSLSQPPSPGRSGVHKSEAGTEAALEGKCGLCLGRQGHYAGLQCVTLLPVRERRLLHHPEMHRLPPFIPPLHARSARPETGETSVLSYLKC